MKKNQKSKVGQIAFWLYDTFPGFVSGEITYVYSDGIVETKEYGRGYRFTPWIVLPQKQAEAFQLKLLQLKTLRGEMISAIDSQMMMRKNEIVNEMIKASHE